MELKEQLKKCQEDIQKLDDKKEKFFQDYDVRRKKLLQKKKEIEEKIRQEKNEKILRAVEENFGEVTEENLEQLCEAIRKNRIETIPQEEIPSAFSGADDEIL